MDLEKDSVPIAVPKSKNSSTMSKSSSKNSLSSMYVDIPEKTSAFRFRTKKKRSFIRWEDEASEEEEDELEENFNFIESQAGALYRDDSGNSHSGESSATMGSNGNNHDFDFDGSPSSLPDIYFNAWSQTQAHSLPANKSIHSSLHVHTGGMKALLPNMKSAMLSDCGLELIPEAVAKCNEDVREAFFNLIRRTQGGMLKGYRPVPIQEELSTGGAYYLRDRVGQIAAIYKPENVESLFSSDDHVQTTCAFDAPSIFTDYIGGEEAMLGEESDAGSLSVSHSLDLRGSGFANPRYPHSRVPRLVKQYSSRQQERESAASPTILRRTSDASEKALGLKAGVRPGESAAREVAAYLLDHDSMAGVPVTTLIRIQNESLGGNTWTSGPAWKIGSLQQYHPHDSSSEDVAAGLLPVSGVHRVGILDIRMFNTDRHEGNILLETSRPPSADAEVLRRPSSDSDVLASAFAIDEKADAADSPSSTSSMGSARRWDTAASSVKMVPIDHGFCLPDVRTLNEARFCWMDWPQSKQPFSKNMLDYISSLDGESDCELLKFHLGDRMRNSALLTLRVCTEFLKQCALDHSLSLFEIGTLMCRGACEETPSWLEKIVLLASPEDALDDGSDEAFDAFVKRFKDYLSESDPSAALSALLCK